MAKRLNKKVAIIGSLVLAMLIMASIVAILRLSRSPQKYLADAQAALALKEPDYKAAEKAYGMAFAYAKKNIELKIDILFKLADMYISHNEWPKAAGCWNQIINFDTKNLKARLAILDYNYRIATSGNWMTWKEIESNVSEMIDKKLDTSPRMYRLKGQALVELVKHGQMTDKDKAVNDAMENLQKASQTEPNNVDVYQYLADAIVQKGEIAAAKGILKSVENARQEADKVMQKGVEALPNEPKAYINLYNSKLSEAGDDQDKIKKVETDIIKLTQKFPDSALPYFALAQLYQRSPKDIDKAIASIEKSIQFDKQNVTYALTAATLYYRKYIVNKDQQDFQKAIDIAVEALSCPESLDVPGPKARISFINRYSLHTFLAGCYLDMATEPAGGQTKTSNWQELGEKEVYQIDQLLGSAENPYAVMWQGRILLAKGQKDEAIVQMYAAYQKLTAAGSAQTQGDAQLGILAYELAKIYQNTTETGATVQFYSTALKNGVHYSRPEILLNFATALIRVQDWQHSLEALDFFDKNFGGNNQSRDLRISAYLGANMLDKAQEMFDKLSDDDPNVLRLKNMFYNAKVTQTNWELIQKQPGKEQQLQQNEQNQQLKVKNEQMKNESRKIRDKLAAIGCKQITEAELSDMYKRYVNDGEDKKAATFVNNYLVIHPNSVSASMYKVILAEPSPVNVPPERLEQITSQVFGAMKDPIRSGIGLGQYYQQRDKKEEAAKCYDKVLQIAPDNNDAIIGLFDIAISEKNFSRAQEIAETARKNNIDSCGGELFKARLAFARGEYQTAIERTNNCLEKRPVFSQAYLLRSQAYSAIGKESDAIDDAKKAYSFSPVDSYVARNLAYMLYNRNQKLGDTATVEQIAETRNALEVAIRANPMDNNLKSFYAQFISSSEPDRAIAISQQLQKAMPTVDNSLRLASLAFRLAQQSRVQSQRDVYNTIAMDAYKKAYELAPNDSRVIAAYTEYLRSNGKSDEAEKILTNRDDLLWRFYVRSGKMDEAQKELDKLYKANPEDINTIKGLLYVSRSKNDQAGVLKYSDNLLKIDKSLDNQIAQIESYLEVGLADEAQTKLASVREKYPDEPRALFLQTWQIAKQGKLDEALKLANRDLELDKSNPRAWRLRGQINLGLNNYNQAIDDLQKSKALSDNADVRIDLARVYARTGRDEQAIAELKAAIDELGSNVARGMLEEIYYKTGKVDQLSKFYQETITKFPDDVYWHNHAGNLALNTQNFDASYKYYDAAYQNSLKINSQSPDIEAFDGRMKSLLGAKKYDQLQAEATKYLDGPFASIAYSRMADAKAYAGDKASAVQYFRRALEKAGTNENFIIEILKEMNNTVGFDETVKWCNEKIQSQPDSIAVNIALFNLYNINQQYNKALEYADNCIKLTTDSEQVKTLRFNKATLLYAVYNKTSDKTYLEKAIKEYESILQKEPTNIAVLNNLAYMLIESHMDAGKALEYAERAYKTASNNANVIDTYGYVLLKNGKLKEADEYMQRALQQYEKDKMSAPMDVYEHIGMVKEKLGQDAEALDAYKRAMELASKDISQEVKNRISAAIERLSSKK
jgi:tetratricopeptide (TPR) repeat protein